MCDLFLHRGLCCCLISVKSRTPKSNELPIIDTSTLRLKESFWVTKFPGKRYELLCCFIALFFFQEIWIDIPSILYASLCILVERWVAGAPSTMYFRSTSMLQAPLFSAIQVFCRSSASNCTLDNKHGAHRGWVFKIFTPKIQIIAFVLFQSALSFPHSLNISLLLRKSDNMRSTGGSIVIDIIINIKGRFSFVHIQDLLRGQQKSHFPPRSQKYPVTHI